jgi:hypothetical protein
MLLLRSLSFALTLMILLACAARGQSTSASVAMSGHVSETVLLSIAPTAQPTDTETLVSHVNLNARTILVSIKTSGSRTRQISLHLQIRSNTCFTLSASANGTALSGLRVSEARATGRFVAVDAVEAMNVAAEFDATTDAGRMQRASLGTLRLPSPVTLLTGPRISLAGTHDSPHNAVEVMILAEIAPTAEGEPQSIEMILTASPNGSSPLAALASR